MKKKLRRSKKERVFLGVLGGIAEYLDVDPTFVRLGFLLLFIFNPVAMTVFYFLAAIIMSSEEEGEDIGERAERVLREVEDAIRADSNRDEKLIGVILLLVGIVLLGRAFVPAPLDTQTVIAALLLIAGVMLLLRGD